MMEWIFLFGIGIFWFTLSICAIAFILEYFHNRSLRRHQATMEDEYTEHSRIQAAREEELAKEQRQAILEETDREYMDVMRAEEIIRELEKGNMK